MNDACPLTPAQIEVVQWLSHGKNYSDIAEIIGATSKAIYRRMDRAWVSTGTQNRHGIVAMALRKGWIE